MTIVSTKKLKKTKKKFFIASINHTSLYNAPDHAVLIPTLHTSQMFIQQYETNVRCIYMEGHRHRVVFKMRDSVQLCVFSPCFEDDQEESPGFLSKQLDLFFGLLGLYIPFSGIGSNSSLRSQNHFRKCHGLVEAMCNLVAKRQCYWVHGYETVELTSMNRKTITEILEKGCMATDFICQSMLLVHDKVAAIFTRPNSFILQPKDIMSLIIYSHANTLNSPPIKIGPLEPTVEKESEERESEKVIDSKYEHLYIHTQSHSQGQCSVHSSQIGENIRLIMICTFDPKKSRKSKLKKLVKKTQKKLKIYENFLQTRGSAHINMLHYLHHCPGLIHFIFKDKLRGRVIAPVITDLTDQQDDNQDTPVFTVDFIQEQVQKMCHLMQEYQVQGFHEACVSFKRCQFYYHEWLVGSDGNELKFDPKNFKFAVDHFELYTMYLPFVSTQAIRTYNSKLVKKILTHLQ